MRSYTFDLRNLNLCVIGKIKKEHKLFDKLISTETELGIERFIKANEKDPRFVRDLVWNEIEESIIVDYDKPEQLTLEEIVAISFPSYHEGWRGYDYDRDTVKVFEILDDIVLEVRRFTNTCELLNEEHGNQCYHILHELPREVPHVLTLYIFGDYRAREFTRLTGGQYYFLKFKPLEEEAFDKITAELKRHHVILDSHSEND